MFQKYSRVNTKTNTNERLWISSADYVYANHPKTHQKVPVIRLFCLYPDGTPRCISVWDFEAYFYFKASCPWGENHNNDLEEFLGETMENSNDFSNNHQNTIGKRKRDTLDKLKSDEDVEDDDHAPHMLPREFVPFFRQSMNTPNKPKLVRGVHIKQCTNIMGARLANEPPDQVYKVRLQRPEHVTKASRWISKHLPDVTLFETDVIFFMRFLVDMELGTGHWIDPVPNNNVYYDGTKIIRPAVDVSKDVPPMRILSFDIECVAVNGGFPQATNDDPCIQIACEVRNYNAAMDLVARVVLSYGECQPEKDQRNKDNIFECYSFNNEQDLLKAWYEFLHAVQPNIITGYNIISFDIPYIMNRMKRLNMDKRYLCWGSKADTMIRIEHTFYSKASGEKIVVDFKGLCGITIIDVYTWFQCNRKERSYTLNNIASKYLDMTKEDVPHSLIKVLWRGLNGDRYRLASYCMTDATLALILLTKMCIISQTIEISRLCLVPMIWQYTRGLQIRITTLLLAATKKPYASAKNYILPMLRKRALLDGEEEGYTGAVVIEPLTGAYIEDDDMIMTQDMEALYPSIMKRFNLGVSSWIQPHREQAFRAEYGDRFEDAVTKTPAGHLFLKTNVMKCIENFVLEDLHAGRNDAKQRMKKETDKFKKSILDGLQLALKLTANALYGYYGALNSGRMPCIPISESVTGFGQEIILGVKKRFDVEMASIEAVQKEFGEEFVLKAPPKVIYGDTDSVMVWLKCSLATAYALGPKFSKWINAAWEAPLNIQFEKVYRKYLLFDKKRYAGIKCIPGDPEKLETKGIETVRRDVCPLVSKTVGVALDYICIKSKPADAVKYVHGVLKQLYMNKIDVSDLILSKGYSKTADKYANPQSHVEVAQRMKKRDSASAPVIGDRIAYVVTAGLKGDKVCVKTEDPVYAIEHDIPLDITYYVDQQLTKPLIRLFKPLYNNNEDLTFRTLFVGDHMNHKVINCQPNPNGGLGKWIVKRASCLNCGVSLPQKNKGLCDSCNERRAPITLEFEQTHQAFVETSKQIWNKCIGCAKWKPPQSDTNDNALVRPDVSSIPCASRDCNNFFRRIMCLKNETQSEDKLRKLLEW